MGEKMVRMEYPSNSNKKQTQKEVTARKEPKQIISGGVKTKKKNLSARMGDTFLGGNLEDVKDYIIWDVVVPSLKCALNDVITGSSQKLIFGDVRPKNVNRHNGRSSIINYNGMSSGGNKNISKANGNYNSKALGDIDGLVFDNRTDAEEVLSYLVTCIDEYGIVSVADLYAIVGMAAVHTDQKYGWTNLASANVDRVPDGYLLRLPKVGEI